MFIAPEPPVPFTLPYTGERLEWAISVIGWSKNYFCVRLDIDHGSLRQMLAGRRFIPDIMGIWVETLALQHLMFAKPMGWRPKPGSEPDRLGYDPSPGDPDPPILLDNKTD